MRAITLASQKGGTGKSTLCIGLAVAAKEDGERVFILETDRQGTIANWAARRANPERVAERFQLERALRALQRRGCTLAIIDTPGSDNDLVADAIRAAMVCLVPARPSLADIEATHPTLKTIRGLGKEFAFVLNQTPPRGQRPSRCALRFERGWRARASLHRAAQRPYGLARSWSRRFRICTRQYCCCRNPGPLGLVKTKIGDELPGRETSSGTRRGTGNAD